MRTIPRTFVSIRPLTLPGVAGLIAMFLIVMLLIGCGGVTKMSATPSPSPSPSPTPSPSPSPTPSPTPTPIPAPTPVTCPSVTRTQAQGPTSGVAPFPDPAPIPPPNPGSNSAGSICVSTPSNDATVNSPVHLVAGASLTGAIDHMRVYVDGQANYFTFFNEMDALLWMDPGQHTVEILATDKSGNNVSNTFNVNVVAPQNPDVTQIQNMPNWEQCSAAFPPGNPRAGQICAAGLGDAESQMIPNQSSPSLSGSSAKFTMGGPHKYSNELYYKALGGGRNVSHFIYDLSFYVDKPDVVQALEFDLNQTFDNKRWVFGTECNFKDTGKWDIWDGVNGWQPTSVPCTPFPANTWIHLVWTFERVGDQVHYISLQINDQTFKIDRFQNREKFWPMEDINAAFQMDGDFQQDPFNVWLDNVKVTAW